MAKTAIITGATRGIGLAIAEALAAEKLDIAVCGRTRETAEHTARTIHERFGVRALGDACDVADYESASRFVSRVAEELGSVDILVNNAGIGKFAPITELSAEEFRRIIEVNVIGVFNFCHVAIPHMRKAGEGFIVNISSLAGANAFAGGTAYNASKFAVNGFSEALMQDVRHENIRVSYVMPGSVATEFHGRKADDGLDWRLHPIDVAEVVVGLLRSDPRALSSRVELRPSRPKK